MRYALVLFLAALSACAHADWVFLKSGKSLQGEVVSQDDKFVVLRVVSGEIKLRAEDVESVEKQTPQEYKLDVGGQLIQQRRFDRGVAMLEEAFVADKSSSLARRKLALGYAETATYYKDHNRLNDARDVCEKWLKLDPTAKNRELMGEDARRVLDQVLDAEKKVDDAILSAKTFVQGEDWNSAIAAFEHAINLTPDARHQVSDEIAQCYVSRAAAHAHQGLQLNAAADIEAALSFDPSLADKLEQFYISCALPSILENIARGNVSGAQADIKRVLGFVPANKSVLYVAGRIAEAAGKLPMAADAYSRAVGTRAANPTPAYVASVRKRIETELGIKGDAWAIDTGLADSSAIAQSEEGPAQTKESENFIVLHHNAALADKVAEAAEFCRMDVSARLGLTPLWKGKVKIVLHRTQAEYTARTGQPEWTGGVSKFSSESGRLSDLQIHSWQTSPRLLKSVLPHEITHLIVNSNMNDITAMPRALHEGFAVMMEPTYRQEYFMNFLRLRIKSRDFIPLADLISVRDYPRDPEFFYAEGYAMASFLAQEKGMAGAVGLIKNSTLQTRPEVELLRASGRHSLEDLQADWLEWMSKPRTKK